jgi:hypothetical protein
VACCGHARNDNPRQKVIQPATLTLAKGDTTYYDSGNSPAEAGHHSKRRRTMSTRTKRKRIATPKSYTNALPALKRAAKAAKQMAQATADAAAWMPPKVTVWYARDEQCDAGIGYYITEPDNPDLPIAYVDTTDTTEREPWEDVQTIALDPAMIAPLSLDGRCVDLRRFGRRDSTEEVPGFVFSFWIAKSNGMEGECDHKFIQCSPYCPVRFRRWESMALQAAHALTEEQRLAALGRLVGMEPDDSLLPILSRVIESIRGYNAGLAA